MQLTTVEKVSASLDKLQIIVAEGQAKQLLRRLYDQGPEELYALDFETTALSPGYGQVRLTAIYDHINDIPHIIDHYAAGSFSRLAKHFLKSTWCVYNAKFETRWFDDAVPNQVELFDVDFFAKSSEGGGYSSLAAMVRRDLGVDLSKDLQNSDWSNKILSQSQYRYAASDAIYTYLLLDYWRRRVASEVPEHQQAGVKRGAWIMQDAVRATVECEDTGLELDIDYHKVNIARWSMKSRATLYTLRRWTGKDVIGNLNSKKQVSDWLKTQLGEKALKLWPKTEKAEQLKLERSTVRAFAKRMPYPMSRWLNAYASFNYYQKYLSTYGETLINKQLVGGVINYRLNIAQAATGRYSSSSINVQNLPRSPIVRKAFLPPEPFEVLVGYDYSGIEIRVLAELSGDTQLIHDAIYGDLHSEMAAIKMKIDADLFRERRAAGVRGYSEARSKAKAGTFRLTYGAGPGAVADSMGASLDEAHEFMRNWAARYPKAWNYRQIMHTEMTRTGYLPIVSGRRVYVPKQDREMPVAANYPIQGAAADVMMRAMYHVRELRDQRSTPDLIRLCATVHDELVLATYPNQVATAEAILSEGMTRGWLDIFPGTDTTNLIEGGHGSNWGETK